MMNYNKYFLNDYDENQEYIKNENMKEYLEDDEKMELF